MLFNLALTGFCVGFLLLGLRRPFVWVLAYIYVDIVTPQKMAYAILPSIPVSLIAFIAAVGGWLLADPKTDLRVNPRQALIGVLLIYCFMTTVNAAFPEAAWAKWDWVWKALVFALFLPLTLTNRLRIEGTILVMLLSLGSIVINGGIKTLGGGGGYDALALPVLENAGLYEGSTLSMAAIASVPLILWAMRHSTVFPPDWKVRAFCLAYVFSCLLIPVGTAARTGLLCIGVLAILMLRSVKRRGPYIAGLVVALFVAIPFLPASYTNRMSTIENHSGDQSASTRLAVWQWTIGYAAQHPMGGGFDSYLANEVRYTKVESDTVGGTTLVEDDVVTETARAFHSAYFEMLGEQGWPGLALWLTIMLGGIVQMERVRARARHWTDPERAWIAPLAVALQQGQVVTMVGALFVGIAYQPYIYLLVALQIALANIVSRETGAAREEDRRERLRRQRAGNRSTGMTA